MIDLPFSLTVYHLLNKQAIVKLIILRLFTFILILFMEVINLLEVGTIKTALRLLVCF